MAFSEEPIRAIELASLDHHAERANVDKCYDKLLESRIKTPESVIDEAFRSALYNLEYVWIEPYGWLECIHHWVSMWHMQCTVGAEWLGQVDRSRLCTLTHTEHLLPDGAIPQFGPSGHTRKDWGG